MKKFLRYLLVFAVLNFSQMSNSAVLSSLIDAMAIPIEDSSTSNSWEDTVKIQNVKWKWPLSKIGEHFSDDAIYGYSMVGKMKIGNNKNLNLNWADISIRGDRTMIQTVGISIVISPDSKFFGELGDFGTGRFNKIRTECDNDSFMNTISFYEFRKNGYKPLYISSVSSAGASGEGSQDYVIAYSIEDTQANICSM